MFIGNNNSKFCLAKQEHKIGTIAIAYHLLMLFGDEILHSQFSWIFYEGGIFHNIIQLFFGILYKTIVTISVLSLFLMIHNLLGHAIHYDL